MAIYAFDPITDPYAERVTQTDSPYSDIPACPVNGCVDFDSPFTVTAPGTFATYPDAADVYAPDVYSDDTVDGPWELVSGGYTGQYGYNGPIMHPSEYFGGGMARDILSEPGTYVIVEVADSDTGSFPDGDPIGWALLRYIG